VTAAGGGKVKLAAPATFTVSGDWLCVDDAALSATSSDPQLQTVYGLILFTPRLLRGHVSYTAGFSIPEPTPSISVVPVPDSTPPTPVRVADTGISLVPRQARIWAGRLATIDVVDSLDVVLVGADPKLGLDGLIYDVVFTQIQFGRSAGVLAPFAFEAPTVGKVCLTDPSLPRLPWMKPQL